MSTHDIGFYGKLNKNYFQLSSNVHLIYSQVINTIYFVEKQQSVKSIYYSKWRYANIYNTSVV